MAKDSAECLEPLGPHVRLERERRNIGLREMARRIGISATYMSRIERGQLSPGEDVIIKLAGVLADNVDSLMARERRLSPDLEEIILRKPVAMAGLIRELDGLSENDIEELKRRARSLGSREKPATKGRTA